MRRGGGRTLLFVVIALGFTIAHFLATFLSLTITLAGVISTNPAHSGPQTVWYYLLAVLSCPGSLVIGLAGGMFPAFDPVSILIANSLLWGAALAFLLFKLTGRRKRAADSAGGSGIRRLPPAAKLGAIDGTADGTTEVPAPSRPLKSSKTW